MLAASRLLIHILGGILLSASAKGDRQKQWIYCMQNPGSPCEYWHELELEQ